MCVMMSDEVRIAIEMEGVPSCWRAEEGVLFGNWEAMRLSRVVKNEEDVAGAAIVLAKATLAVRPSGTEM